MTKREWKARRLAQRQEKRRKRREKRALAKLTAWLMPGLMTPNVKWFSLNVD